MEAEKHMEMVSMLPHTRSRCQSRMLMRLIFQLRSTITQGTQSLCGSRFDCVAMY